MDVRFVKGGVGRPNPDLQAGASPVRRTAVRAAVAEGW